MVEVESVRDRTMRVWTATWQRSTLGPGARVGLRTVPGCVFLTSPLQRCGPEELSYLAPDPDQAAVMDAVWQAAEEHRCRARTMKLARRIAGLLMEPVGICVGNADSRCYTGGA